MAYSCLVLKGDENSNKGTPALNQRTCALDDKTTGAGASMPIALLGNTFLIGWGTAFFVSGLLGWLLVMKKRVLQCDVCGAIVSAS